MKVILFGAGRWGREALSYFKQENVYCFCDNNVRAGQEKLACGKRVISFQELLEIHKEYVIVISTGTDFIEEISNQLDTAGIEDYFIYYVLIRNDLEAGELIKNLNESGRDQTFKKYYKTFVKWTEAKLQYLKNHVDIKTLKPAKGALRETQMKILEIAEEFFEMVKELEITPFLNFGNLLGAYRNRGFIPWDDDLDFGIMRNDYDRMMEFAKDKCVVGTRIGEMWYGVSGEILPWKELFEKYPNTFVLEVQSRMTQVFRNDYSNEWKHAMDFWVFDYYKEGYDHAEHRKWLGELNEKIHTIGNERERVVFLRQEWEKNLMISREVTGNIFPGIDNNGGYVFSTRRDIDKWIPGDRLFPLEKVKYEGTEFYAPRDMEYLLELEYGDYMQLPYDIGEPRHGKCLE